MNEIQFAQWLGKIINLLGDYDVYNPAQYHPNVYIEHIQTNKRYHIKVTELFEED